MLLPTPPEIRSARAYLSASGQVTAYTWHHKLFVDTTRFPDAPLPE